LQFFLLSILNCKMIVLVTMRTARSRLIALEMDLNST
jgi:hypothetical protein